MSGVRVELLGSTTLTIDSTPVELKRSQVRRLVTVLAARHDIYVSADSLIECIWHDSLPADPRAALAVAMSRVRSALGPHRELLRSDSRGHRLDVDTDVQEFDAALVAARSADSPALRLELLETCHRLWRGTPFGSDAGVELLAPMASRLEEARWSSVTLLIEAAAEQGDHDRVIAVGRPLHEAQPQRERLTVALARSLSATGRRSEALDVLAATRVWLRDNLGLDASPLLARAEMEILQSSVELVEVPRPAATGVDEHFIGRRMITEQLVVAEAAVHVVVGEPGIGKSALLRHAARSLRQSGVSVVQVDVSPSAERPLDAIASLVDALLDGRSLENESDYSRAALARVLPGRVVDTQLVAITRDVLVESLGAFIVAAAPAERAVIMIDDVHWIDQVSLTVLERVAAAGVCRLVLGTRPEWSPPESMHGVRRHDLDPMSPADVVELLELTLPTRADAELAADLADRSGGNPLFVTLLIDLIAEGDASGQQLPTSVLLAVQDRLQTLSNRARVMVQAASVFGTNVPMAGLRQMVATAEADIDEAVGAGLMTIDLGLDRARFSHALVGEGAYQLIAEGRRLALHDEVGEVLRSLAASPGELARHFHEAHGFDVHRAAEAHVLAAADFAQTYSWEQVEFHALKGLELAHSMDPLSEARLAVWLGRSQRELHRVEANDSLIRGANAARAVGDVELFADAAIALSFQTWSMEGNVHDGAQGLLEEALATSVSRTMRARLCAAASTLSMSRHHVRARELYHEAIEIALDLDDLTVQVEVLRLGRWGLSHPDDLATLIEVTELLSAVAGSDVDSEWGVAVNRYAIGTITGDAPLVKQAFESLREIHGRGTRSARDWEMAHIETSYALLTGDLDRADSELDRTFALAASAATATWMYPIYGACLVATRRAQGRLAEVDAFLTLAIERIPEFAGWRAVAAGVAASVGDLDRARYELGLVTGPGLETVTPDSAWSGLMMILSDVAVALQDRAVASELVEMLRPYSGRMSWAGVCSAGPIDASLASLHTLLGDHHQAEVHRGEAERLTSAFHSLLVEPG